MIGTIRRRRFASLLIIASAAMTLHAQEPGETTLRLDFGAARTAEGFSAAANTTPYTAERGYGWVGAMPGAMRDRGGSDALARDFVYGMDAADFRVDLEPGIYRIRMHFADLEYGDHFIQPSLSAGDVRYPVLNPAKGEKVTATASIDVEESSLTITWDSPQDNWIINGLEVEPDTAVRPLEITGTELAPSGQQICLRETDPNSPRRTALTSNSPNSTEIIRTDVDEDGDPDILERWWNGKRIRWFDENDNMLAGDAHGDLADDSLQIDRDGDGYFDGPSDMTVDWVDNDGDGDADLQVVSINPSVEQPSVYAHESHYMIFEDIDDDDVHGCPEWQGFSFPCWRFTGEGNFTPDYHGDSIFLKEHLPAFALTDPRYNWENPFAFYDTDNDGVTEMTIRYTDSRIMGPDETASYDGKADHAFVSFDLDNDSQRDNEMDFDMTIEFAGGAMDYSHYVNEYPALAAPEWVLPYFRYTNWRVIDELIYTPHDRCYEDMFAYKDWQLTRFTFDEDDDDHRWERVELYQEGDPYTTGRRSQGSTGMASHPQADSLGDRGEFDLDNSGKGNLYIASWDQRLHLYGAEWGAWLVDKNREYWGSHPVTGGSSPKQATAVRQVVQYKDTNENGFIDFVQFDYDGDRQIDLEVSLLDYASAENPEPDVFDIIDTGSEEWEGMHAIFEEMTDASWKSAQLLYRAAWKRGLAGATLDSLAIASSTHQKYEQAYRLRERLLRKLLLLLDEEDGENVKELFFTGRFEDLAEFIETTSAFDNITQETHTGILPRYNPVIVQPNSAWCWYQDDRIIHADGKFFLGTIASENKAGLSRGDAGIASWNPDTGETEYHTLARLNPDDHNVPVLLELPDGRLLSTYQNHGQDTLMRWRITKRPHDISEWTPEKTLDLHGGNTYSNPMMLANESNRIYSFSRVTRGNPIGANPNYTYSDDLGSTFRYGGRLLLWPSHREDPASTGIDGSRPYLKYATDGASTIHFVTTEDHPRAYDNSIYHGYYRDGNIYKSNGSVLGPLADSDQAVISPQDLTLVFQGDADNVAWTIDLELDVFNNPYCVFSVQKDGAASRGLVGASVDGQDHRYYYGRWDGGKWNVHEMCYAGSRLYATEDDYTGLAALHPNDPKVVYISADVNPVTGEPLISLRDGKRHYEIFRGDTTDGGATWKWQAVTKDSTVDHIRPIIPKWKSGQTAIFWMMGTYVNFTRYDMDIVAVIEPKEAKGTNLSVTRNQMRQDRVTADGAR